MKLIIAVTLAAAAIAAQLKLEDSHATTPICTLTKSNEVIGSSCDVFVGANSINRNALAIDTLEATVNTMSTTVSGLSDQFADLKTALHMNQYSGHCVDDAGARPPHCYGTGAASASACLAVCAASEGCAAYEWGQASHAPYAVGGTFCQLSYPTGLPESCPTGYTASSATSHPHTDKPIAGGMGAPSGTTCNMMPLARVSALESAVNGPDLFPFLDNPTDVGSAVQTFCASGCDQACPAGAKGPGWHLPGGSNDAAAELRWDGVELNTNYFTVSMWVNLDNENSDIGLFSYGDYPTDQGFMVQMRSVHAHDFHVRAASAETPGFGSFDSSPNVYTGAQTVGTWFHVAVVKDGNTEIRFYINGQQVGSPNTAFDGKPNTMPGHRHFNVGSWFENNKILDGRVSNIHVLTSNDDSTMALDDAAMEQLYTDESTLTC